MVKIRFRVCLRCKTHVPIKPDDFSNQTIEKYFELQHKGHTLITADFEDVKSIYKNHRLIDSENFLLNSLR